MSWKKTVAGPVARKGRLGLVTQALLVPVQLHALAALVLGDLGFAFLLDGSHRAFLCGSVEAVR